MEDGSGAEIRDWRFLTVVMQQYAGVHCPGVEHSRSNRHPGVSTAKHARGFCVAAENNKNVWLVNY